MSSNSLNGSGASGLKQSFVAALKTFFSYQSNSISRRLLILVVSFSSLFAMVQTIAQLKADYDLGIGEIQHQFDQIEKSHGMAMAQAIWEVFPEQVSSISEGIRSLPNVVSVVVLEKLSNARDGEVSELFATGKDYEKGTISREIELVHFFQGKRKNIGVLKVEVSLARLKTELFDRAFFLLIFQAVKTLSVSIFILLIFHLLVTQHLIKMTVFAKAIGVNNIDEPLVLDRRKGFADDELDTMSKAINDAEKNLRQSINAKQSRLALESELQQRIEKDQIQAVHGREMTAKNQQLAQQNLLLEKAMQELTYTQEQLVQTKTLASLGLLVRGVAHELSTPLSIIKMAHSIFDQTLTTLPVQQETANTRKKLDDNSSLIGANVERCVQLLGSFKRVASDDLDRAPSQFGLKDFLLNRIVLLNISSEGKKLRNTIDVPEQLTICCNATALAKSVDELLQNSLDHSVNDCIELSISATTHEGKVEILIIDDGPGVPQAIIEKLFDPFFTTSNAAHHIGLGLHVAYNATSQHLGGELKILPRQTGFGICIAFREAKLDPIRNREQ